MPSTKITKHDLDASVFEEIEEMVGGVVDAIPEAVPDFDNLLEWPGCTRVTNPTDESTNTTVERWVDSATKSIVKAQRTTVKNDDGSYTENYIFYTEDGATEKMRYTVETSKDGETSIYYETVTKEEVSE